VNITGASLNWILYTKDSQCSSFRAGRTWSRRDNPRSRRAAAFWTRYKGAIVQRADPYKRVTVIESAEDEGADWLPYNFDSDVTFQLPEPM